MKSLGLEQFAVSRLPLAVVEEAMVAALKSSRKRSREEVDEDSISTDKRNATPVESDDDSEEVDGKRQLSQFRALAPCRGGCQLYRAKKGCPNIMCVRCCLKSEEPCEIHLEQQKELHDAEKMLRRGEWKENQAQQPKKVLKGQFIDPLFEATSNTVTIWCARDFFYGAPRLSEDMMKSLSRSQRGASRIPRWASSMPPPSSAPGSKSTTKGGPAGPGGRAGRVTPPLTTANGEGGGEGVKGGEGRSRAIFDPARGVWRYRGPRYAVVRRRRERNWSKFNRVWDRLKEQQQQQ